MDIDKEIIVNIALVIHMALTGIALIRLFKVKNATGGLVILSLLSMMIPVLGPSALIVYLNNLIKKQEHEKKNTKQYSFSPKPKIKNGNKK